MAANDSTARSYPFGMDPNRFKVNQADMDTFTRRLMRTKTLASASSVDEESGSVSGDAHAPGGGGGGGGGGRLERVLTTFDLTSLGVGSCVGTGMYVVAGMVAKNVAGPSAILSFCIAAFASILSGVCYGEFGVRVPKTSGSAYMYSYVAVGEFVAFLIGWNLILEYMIGSAAGASALSACFDALIDHKLSEFLEAHIGTVIGKTYPDLLGCAICLLMTAVLALGAKGSVRFNTILNGINLVVWVFIVIAGLVYADFSNWSQIGFAPYGASGVFSGAATCFYAFIGFDIIATTGEEARSPSRSIPIAIVTSLIICLTAYVSVTMVLTLMVPYYEIHGASSLIDAFDQVGFGDAKYVVALGALASLTVSLLGSMWPMPRVIYAMSRDGLLFGFLSGVHERTGTPLIATCVCGVLAAGMTLFVGLAVLVELMSIGTLLAYTLVSVSVLILRYQPSKHELPIPLAHRLDPIAESPGSSALGAGEEEEAMVDSEDVFSDPDRARRQLKDDQGLLNGGTGNPPPKWYGALPFSSEAIESKVAMVKRHAKMLWLRLGFPSDDCLPTEASAKIVIIFVGLLAISELCVCLLLVFCEGELARGAAWAWVLLIVSILLVIACECAILRQPQNMTKLRFMAPGVPFLPSAAMLMNIYLMLKLPALTWARLGIWICIGLLLYFSYSMFHSNKEHKTIKKEQKQATIKQNGGQTDLGNPLHSGYEQEEDKHLSNGFTQPMIPNGNTIQNGHVASEGKTQNIPEYNNYKVTGSSAPGAPPSRPPPPRQESIEKYMHGTNGRNPSSSSMEQRSDADGVYESQRSAYDNSTAHTAPQYEDTLSRQNSTPSAETSRSEPVQRQQRRRSQRMSDDECDPFAQEDREYRKSTNAKARPTISKQTYDRAMARPRPKSRDHALANSPQSMPLRPAEQRHHNVHSQDREENHEQW